MTSKDQRPLSFDTRAATGRSPVGRPATDIGLSTAAAADAGTETPRTTIAESVFTKVPGQKTNTGASEALTIDALPTSNTRNGKGTRKGHRAGDTGRPEAAAPAQMPFAVIESVIRSTGQLLPGQQLPYRTHQAIMDALRNQGFAGVLRNLHNRNVNAVIENIRDRLDISDAGTVTLHIDPTHWRPQRRSAPVQVRFALIESVIRLTSQLRPGQPLADPASQSIMDALRSQGFAGVLRNLPNRNVNAVIENIRGRLDISDAGTVTLYIDLAHWRDGFIAHNVMNPRRLTD